MAAGSAVEVEVLDAVTNAAPYLRWRLRISHTHEGERLIAVGGSPVADLTPEEAAVEAARVLRAARQAAGLPLAADYSLDVHITARDGREYPAAHA